ncbi:MAG: hypothetical protein Q9M31_03765 [Mariprofundus sp.]|nr:hypothetical protein [Mariprofundus sp.]
MALTISPADGFISRLLQQSQSNSPAKAAVVKQAQAQSKADQASISPEAQAAMQNGGSAKADSKLIDMYNQKSGYSAYK